MGRQWVLTVIVALIASGIWPFLAFLLKRKPEVRQLDAQTTSITIQGAETTVTVLMRSLERAEAREASLEAKLADREAKIDDLERRLSEMDREVATTQAAMGRLAVELEATKAQLAELRQ